MHFLEISSIIFLEKKQKLALIKSVAAGQNFEQNLGIFSNEFHILLKYLIYLFYCLFSAKLLFPFKKVKRNEFFIKNKLLFKWLLFDNYLKIVLIIISLFLVVEYDHILSFAKGFSGLVFGLEMALSILFLIFNPKLLIGVKWVSINVDGESLSGTINRKNDKKILRDRIILERLDKYMKTNEPYKKKITINEIAQAVNISPNKLAYLIRENFNQSFVDYINSFRLTHVDVLISQKKHFKYSFEYVAFEAGFNSKNAFYVAFKKLRNSTPKKYYGDEN
ncbi:helix-turn-helix transcriptional regulator [Flavobacterium humidisoli]|uniref:AraC family transcriptional regulator n=1 Tax=Flavobacterium humidisoli TaxID=2937442 RepID=A0ABY4LXS4_9FLAO|nr:AraC family transcriptional regulator [Flavobacterium humidisoli]UPZ17850.1 AraC family transcriptional regulator [Flavobacterium humidisoli]